MADYPIPLSDKIRPEHCALLVIDMQNDYVHDESALGRAGFNMRQAQSLVPVIGRLVDAAHRCGALVIYTRNWRNPWNESAASRDWAARSKYYLGPNGVANTWGAEWYGVLPGPEDFVINKVRYNAFIATDLDQILRIQGITCLVITGVSTECCVESTARDAFMRDYFVVMVEDGTGTKSEAVHRASLNNLEGYFAQVVKSSEVLDLWEKLPSRPRSS